MSSSVSLYKIVGGTLRVMESIVYHIIYLPLNFAANFFIVIFAVWIFFQTANFTLRFFDYFTNASQRNNPDIKYVHQSLEGHFTKYDIFYFAIAILAATSYFLCKMITIRYYDSNIRDILLSEIIVTQNNAYRKILEAKVIA